MYMKLGGINSYKLYIGRTPVSRIEIRRHVVYTPEIDYSNQYLTLEAVTPGTIAVTTHGKIGSRTLSYSVNGGPWKSATTSSTPGRRRILVRVSIGDIVRIKGNNRSYAFSNNHYMNFEGGTAEFDVYGNIMSMVAGDLFPRVNFLLADYTFCSLFRNCRCISAENLVLPTTVLRTGCYQSMFFKSRLEVAPKILPATTLADYCYWYMFSGCTIRTAPELPYDKKLKGTEYGGMFNGCYNLDYIKCLADGENISGWLKDVSLLGTFVKNPKATQWTEGENGIPENWFVQDDEV